MLSLFIALYVFAEPFEKFGGRWIGIASLSSIVWLEKFDLSDAILYDLEVSHVISSSMCLRNGELLPTLFTIFSILAPFEASSLVNIYIWYVYTLYQIYKIGETEFIMIY